MKTNEVSFAKTNVSTQVKQLLAALTICALAAPAWATTQTATLAVSNMTCSACPITVRKALFGVHGVEKVAINLDKKEAAVTFDDAQTNVNALTKATGDAGYPSHVAGGH